MASTPNLLLFDAGKIVTGLSTRVISASTTKGGAVYLAPKTGNIRYIGTSYSALSGSPALDLRIETVSSLLPTGTLFATNTNAAYSPSATNTFVWTQLTADAAVTEGDLFAAVVGYTSGTSATLNARGSNGIPSINLPYPVLMAAGTWATTGEFPAVGVKYDDGTIVGGALAVSRITSSNISTGTNPNERASVFTSPFAGTISGVRFCVNVAATSEYTVNIYEGTSTTPMSGGTISVGAGEGVNATSNVATLMFSQSISVQALQAYRISIKPTAAVNVSVFRAEFASTADRDATFGALTSDTRNGGAWVGESTTTTELIFPIFDTVTIGSAGVAQGLHSISSGIIA